MTIGVYSIKDHLFTFGDPFVSPDDMTAKRYFGYLVNGVQAKNIMNYKPAEFDLFKVGMYDTESGQLDPVWPVEFIVNGSSVIEDKT